MIVRLLVFVQIFILVSCATKRKLVPEISSIPPQDREVFGDMFLYNSDIIPIFNMYEAGMKYGYIDEIGLRAAQKVIVPREYNLRLVKVGKQTKGYENYLQEHYNLSKSKIGKKLSEAKLQEISSKDFHKYIAEYPTTKEAQERTYLMRMIIQKDFPSSHMAQFIARSALFAGKHDSEREKQELYFKMVSHHQIFYLQLHLYVFQNISTDTLRDIIKLQEAPKYKQAREYVDKLQQKVNKYYLDLVQVKINRERADQKKMQLLQ